MDIVEKLRWTSVHGDQTDAIIALEDGAKEIEKLRRDLAEERAKHSLTIAHCDLVVTKAP